MDKTSFFIINKIRENSRLTYAKLANITGISVSALHKRIKFLVDEGTIIAFITRPSFKLLKYLQVWIYGTSTAKSMDAISKELGQHESITFVGIASGKFLYIAGSLRSISELQDFSTLVSGIAKISEPTVAIVNLPYISLPESLTTIDYKILKTMNRDSRKPIIDIAEDVGLSAKTVRKRINFMIENKLAIFTIEWNPLHKNCFLTFFHIYLYDRTDIHSVINHLNEKYSENLIFCEDYSNIPNFVIFFSWAISPADSQRIQEELQKEGFKDIVPHILLSINWYPCWIDQILKSLSK